MAPMTDTIGDTIQFFLFPLYRCFLVSLAVPILLVDIWSVVRGILDSLIIRINL